MCDFRVKITDLDWKTTKTFWKQYSKLWNRPYELSSYDLFMEFWIGKIFIGGLYGQYLYDEKEIYVDRFFVNDKYRGQGYGKMMTDYLKKHYKYISMECTEDSLDFYKKCGFKKLKKQNNKIYSDTIDIHFKK